MKACGNGERTPLLLNLSTSWRWVLIFTSQLFYPWQKSLWYPFGLDAGRKRKIFSPYGEFNCGSLMDPACSIVTVPTELPCCYRHVCYFLIIKPTRCTNFSYLFWKWNSTCFGQFLCPSSGVIHCTLSNAICHTGLSTAFRQDLLLMDRGSVWNM
jgi:hypothetical protein